MGDVKSYEFLVFSRHDEEYTIRKNGTWWGCSCGERYCEKPEQECAPHVPCPHIMVAIFRLHYVASVKVL
jgi:hypothetical protein